MPAQLNSRRAARLPLAIATAAALALCAGCTLEPQPDRSPGVTTSTSPTVAPTPMPPPLRNGLSNPVADPVFPDRGDPNIDVLLYKLDLIWSPEIGSLAGTATINLRTVRPANTLSLDFAAGLAVVDVTLDDIRVATSRDQDHLIITPDAPLAADALVTLAVRYHGKPAAVMPPSQDPAEGLGLRAVAGSEAWSSANPYGALTWFPVNELPSDKALYDIAVTVPKGWGAIAQGQLIGHDKAADGETYQWRSDDPVASYATMLTLGKYTPVSGTGPHGLSITYWLRTGRDDQLQAQLASTPALLSWLEQRFGPYPYQSLNVVAIDSLITTASHQSVSFGAQVSTQAGNPASASPPTVEQTLLYAYASQWFTDSVSPRTWAQGWIGGGLTKYAEWLWSVEQGRMTDDQWSQWARQVDRGVREVAGPPGSPLPGHFGEVDSYVGPALMLHEINRQIGDQAFFSLARDWAQQGRSRVVDTGDFITFVNRHCGRDLTALINSWVYSPTTPA